MKRLSAALLLSLVAMFTSPQPAFAHASSTSYLILQLPQGDGPVELRWDLAVQDIAWTVFIDADYDGSVTWEEVQNSKGAIGSAKVGPRCRNVTEGGGKATTTKT